MVQRRAARYVLHRYHNTSSVTDMLHTLQWTTLEERRKQQRLAMFYKIHHGLIAVSMANHLIPVTRASRHNHGQAYQIPRLAADYQMYSFFPRTALEWNCLPACIVAAPTLDSFRARLAKGVAARK